MCICHVHNNAISNSPCVASNRRMGVANILEKFWMEAIFTYFRVLSLNVAALPEKNHKNSPDIYSTR